MSILYIMWANGKEENTEETIEAESNAFSASKTDQFL